MNELSRRFATTSAKIQQHIQEATDDLIKVFKGNAGFSLWYFPASLVYTSYRFDHVAILALYKHRKERGNIPTFVVEEGGVIFEFLKEEFEALVQDPNGLARRIFPSGAPEQKA